MGKFLENIEALVRKGIYWAAARRGIGVIIGCLLLLLGGFFGFKMQVSKEPHDFSAHGLAIALELFLAFFLIELIWRHREKHQEEETRKTQLRQIKSHMFQASMRNLFLANIAALEAPKIDLVQLRSSGQYEMLARIFEQITKEENGRLVPDTMKIKYASPNAMAKAFVEYVKAEEKVWERFIQLAVMFNFPQIVKDMTDILTCIASARDAVAPEPLDEMSLSKLLQSQGELQSNIEWILRNGIVKFVEFTEELRQFDLEHKAKTLDVLLDSMVKGARVLVR